MASAGPTSSRGSAGGSAGDSPDDAPRVVSTLDMSQLGELEWDATRVHFVCADSRCRDKALYPDPNNYVVRFPETLTNVLQVELVYAQYEKFTNENYLNLVIDECAPNTIPIDQSEPTSIDAFTQLPVTSGFNEYTRSMFRSFKRFDPPRPKLSRLTISFRTSQGMRGGVKEHFLRFEVRSLPVRADFLPRQLSSSGTQEALVRVLTRLSHRLRMLEGGGGDRPKAPTTSRPAEAAAKKEVQEEDSEASEVREQFSARKLMNVRKVVAPSFLVLMSYLVYLRVRGKVRSFFSGLFDR